MNYSQILDAVNSGQNIFITGPAGTGKSHYLKQLRKDFPVMAITASTGIAAFNIGGRTLHSFFGIGFGDKPANTCFFRMKEDTKYALRKCQMVAIDEISMINNKVFTLVDELMRLVKNVDAPFGGMQVICFGDFLQLPPVKIDEDQDIDFAFASESWEDCNFNVIKLDKIFRQDQKEFLDILHKIRLGNKIDESEHTRIVKNIRKFFIDELKDKELINLFARNYLADELNQKRLNALDGKLFNYYAEDQCDDIYDEKLLTNSEVPAVLSFKKDARVMMLTNKSIGLGIVNGSLGTIVDLTNDGVDVLFDNGARDFITKTRLLEFKRDEILIASRDQLPLKLAWGISIHKSQGMTLDNVKIDMTGLFAHGQAYVALSRARSMDTMYVDNFDINNIKAHPRALAFYENL